MIKRTLVLSVLALIMGVGAASAAPAANWTGFYIGAHAGYGWDDVDYCGPQACLTFDSDGFVGGAYGGYNWQWDGWIAGIDGNFDFLEGKERDSFGVTDEFDPNWEAAVRARVGAFWEDCLFYGAVGITWLDYDWRKSSSTQSETATGWTWAVGIEHQLTSQLRARLEYRHGEYDNDHLEFPGSDREVEPDTDAITIGLSLALN